MTAEKIWHGGILIAYLEDLEKLDASETYPRRINVKEVLIRQKDDEFMFPRARGTAKLLRRDYGFREPTLRRKQTVRRLQGELEECLNRQNLQMTLKPGPIFGRLKVTASIVITLQDFTNLTRQSYPECFVGVH